MQKQLTYHRLMMTRKQGCCLQEERELKEELRVKKEQQGGLQKKMKHPDLVSMMKNHLP